MRIEKLNNDKIKVTLTASELISLDIDVARLSPDSKELHTFLFRIMETIREETGFNPYNGQIVVEASPLDGGISILVSRIRPIATRAAREDLKTPFTVRARTKRFSAPAIFCFENFDDLCAALTELSREELASGSLYRMESVYCYVTETNASLKRAASVMAEFSQRRSRYPMQLTYIKEHGSLVAEGGALADMAENIRKIM